MTAKNTTLIEALAAAQTEMENAAFDSKNNFSRDGKNNYASLTAVRDTVVPALAGHGVAVTQDVIMVEGQMMMRTTLHKGDNKIEGHVPMLVGKNDMHGVGSAMTYARRYGLSSLVGIASDADDDGDLAVANAPKGAQPAKRITQAQAAKLDAEIERTKADATKFCDHFKVRDLGELPANLFDKAMQMLAERERKMIEQAALEAAEAAE